MRQNKNRELISDSIGTEKAPERDAKKLTPVFQRNQIYADCASLSANKSMRIAQAYLRSK
jgi:hypothetical protein